MRAFKLRATKSASQGVLSPLAVLLLFPGSSIRTSTQKALIFLFFFLWILHHRPFCNGHLAFLPAIPDDYAGPVPDIGQTENDVDTVQPAGRSTVRTDFPETWIWTDLTTE